MPYTTTMTNKRKPFRERRASFQISSYCNYEEFKELRAAAQASGEMSFAAWLRKVALAAAREESAEARAAR